MTAHFSAINGDVIPPPASPPLPAARRFIASDGYEHAWRLWSATGPPRGLVVALHGIQSHSGWYGYSAARLADNGFPVAYLDRRGAGLNRRDRGDAPNLDRLVSDVIEFTRHLQREEFANPPCSIIGISWGARIALLAAARCPGLFDRIILQSPAVQSRFRPNRWQSALLPWACAAGAATRTVPIPLDDPALFCESPRFQEFVRTDPHSLRRVTLRFLAISRQIDRQLPAAIPHIEAPLLLMLAQPDRIIDIGHTRGAFASMPSRLRTTIVYPAACHTFEFAENRDEIIGDLTAWLDAPHRLADHTPPDDQTAPITDTALNAKDV